jgi:hypothetical protein
MRSDAISGGLLALFGVYGAWKAHGYGLGVLSQPGAGFFPFWGAVLVVLCGGAVAGAALLRRGASLVEPASPLPSVRWRKVWLCVCALLAYAVLMPYAGFGPSTFLVILGLSRFDPDTTWRGSLIMAILGAIGFWAVFDYLLNVSFPSAAMGF